MKSEPDAGWRRRAWRYVFECQWMNLRQDDIDLPGGEAIQYHVVERPSWVMVVPLLADGSVVMERIFRWPLRQWTLECPSGSVEGPPAGPSEETSEDAARRELEEETGYRAPQLVHLGHYAASDGYSDERFDLYLAPDVRADGVVQREATEAIEIERIPLAELRERVLGGEIEDAPTALAILLAVEKLAS